jgi:opacity protein-like surface antigen
VRDISIRVGILLFSALCILATSAAYAADSSDPLAPVGGPPQPASPAVRPVTENLFGTSVTDNYRDMEKLAVETGAWMKAQGVYTRKVIDAIPLHAALRKLVEAFSGSFGFVLGYVSAGTRQFYEQRAPGSDDFDLIVRDDTGTRKLVDIAAIRAAQESLWDGFHPARGEGRALSGDHDFARPERSTRRAVGPGTAMAQPGRRPIDW